MFEKFYPLFALNKGTTFLALCTPALIASCVIIIFVWIVTLAFEKFIKVKYQKPEAPSNSFYKNYGILLQKSATAVRIVVSLDIIFALISFVFRGASAHLENLKYFENEGLVSSSMKTTSFYLLKTGEYLDRGADMMLISFVIILAAVWASNILENLSNALIVRAETRLGMREKIRNQTLNIVIRNFLKVTITIIALFTILQNIGVNITTLLATAGIVSVALGLGAQTVVKDYIGGFLILVEDQFAVGDEVQINTYRGTVESMTLRMIRIRDSTGGITLIANGDIRAVQNFSMR